MARAAAIARVLARLPVVSTDRRVAEAAGALLEKHGLDSCHAVDAFVVATAADIVDTVILTSDGDDFSRLAAGMVGVVVQSLP